MSELFTHMFVNKSSRQKKVNYVKILSKPLKNLPVKVYIQDFESEESQESMMAAKLLEDFIFIQKTLINFCENNCSYCYT